jgi:hypothetical protein
MTRLNSKTRRAETKQMIAQLQHLMGQPPGPTDQPLNQVVQLSSCPHWGNCLYAMGFSDHERMSCHKCAVFDFALGMALGKKLGLELDIPPDPAVDPAHPEISRLIKDGS